MQLFLASSEPIRSDALFFPPRKPKKKTFSLIPQIFQWLAVACLAMASYYLIAHYVIQFVQVDGVSMMPTLCNSNPCFLNRLTYKVRSPQPTDIVVLKDPAGGLAVKRIIAGPGDSIYFKNGGIYVNGQRVVEPYLAPGTPTYTLNVSWKQRGEELIQCGRNQYFVMGDNRKYSTDSRDYGPVFRNNILGTIVQF